MTLQPFESEAAQLRDRVAYLSRCHGEMESCVAEAQLRAQRAWDANDKLRAALEDIANMGPGEASAQARHRARCALGREMTP